MAVDTLSNAPAPPEVIDWFRSRAHPLKTARPDPDESDLRWLADVVGHARVVSLGEASHGTSEYFTIKDRIVRYLVQHLGFTDFSIEANFAGGRVVDEWVQGAGPDSAEAANVALAHTSYHTWDSVEVLDMIRWMRSYNQGKPEEKRVHFHGFDIGGSALAVRQYLIYLQCVDPDAVDPALVELAPVANGTGGSDREALVRRLDSAIADLDSNRERYEAASSPREFAMTRLGLTDARRGFSVTPTGVAGESMTRRDLAMAANCADILEAAGPDRKLIVWAHNAHVARQTMEVPANVGSAPPPEGSDHEPPELATVKTQGWHLAERFGDEQRVIGFALGGGQVKMWHLFEGRDLRDREFGPPPDDTLDAALARLGEPLVAVDVRNPPTDGLVADWLRAPRRSRSVTAGWFSELSEFFTGRNWLPAYDVIVFVEKSTGVSYNPTVVMSLDEMGGPTEAAPEPTNLDLSSGTAGWHVQNGGSRPDSYRVSVEDGVLEVARPDIGFRTGMGGAMQQIDATPYRGQRVTLAAEVRAETPGLFDRAYLMLAAAGSVESSGEATPDWSLLTASIHVSSEATQLILALRLQGNGTAEFRDLSLRTGD